MKRLGLATAVLALVAAAFAFAPAHAFAHVGWQPAAHAGVAGAHAPVQAQAANAGAGAVMQATHSITTFDAAVGAARTQPASRPQAPPGMRAGNATAYASAFEPIGPQPAFAPAALAQRLRSS